MSDYVMKCKQCQEQNHGSCPVDVTEQYSHKNHPLCNCPKDECVKLRVDPRADYLFENKIDPSQGEHWVMGRAIAARKDRSLPGTPFHFLGLKGTPPKGAIFAMGPRCVAEAELQWRGRLPASFEALVQPYLTNPALKASFLKFLGERVKLTYPDGYAVVENWCNSAAWIWPKFAENKPDEETKNLQTALLSAPKLPRGARLFQGRGMPAEPANEKIEEGKSIVSVGPWSTTYHPAVAMRFVSKERTTDEQLLVIDIDHDAIPGLFTTNAGVVTTEMEVMLPAGCTVQCDKIVQQKICNEHYGALLFVDAKREETEQTEMKNVNVYYVRVTAPPK